MKFSRTHDECKLFIKSYDLDKDNNMSYKEFLKATLTTENSNLRLEVS